MTLHITSNQMKVFGRIARDQFIRRLGERIQAGFPRFVQDRRLDEAGLRHVAKQAVELCESHGVNEIADIQTIVDCLLTLKEPSDAIEILSRDDLSGREKASLLHDVVVFGGA